MVLIPDEILPTTKAGLSFNLFETSTLFITGYNSFFIHKQYGVTSSLGNNP